MSAGEFVWYPSEQVKREANWTCHRDAGLSRAGGQVLFRSRLVLVKLRPLAYGSDSDTTIASAALETLGFTGPELKEGLAVLIEKRSPRFDPRSSV